MDVSIVENLDIACAKAGNNLAERPSKELANLVTNAIAVLEKQGVYALFLFLEKPGGGNENVSCKLHEFLKVTPQQTPLISGNAKICIALQEMAKDLDKLLLAHDLLGQVLAYARCHARLREESEART